MGQENDIRIYIHYNADRFKTEISHKFIYMTISLVLVLPAEYQAT